MNICTPQLLDALRQIGDPTLEDQGATPWRQIPTLPADNGFDGPPEVQLLRTWRRADDGAEPELVADDDPYWRAPTPAPIDIDPRQVEIAQNLFAVYGGEIAAALLLSSLPNAYAAEAGAEVLSTTRELRSNARRRIGETAQLLIDVLVPEDPQRERIQAAVDARTPIPAFPPGGRGHTRVLSTRLTHAVIRDLLRRGGWQSQATLGPIARGVPINQEDLLGTLGTFTVTTFEVMEKLGVPWNDEAERAYFMLWDRVGELLGIGTRDVTDQLYRNGIRLQRGYYGALRPKSVAEARELQELIRQRVWPTPQPGDLPDPFGNANGKLLVRALLDELNTAMPRGLERLPLVVMRYLVHPTAHELLGLGGGGLPDSIMQWPSVERFTRGGGSRPGAALVERSMRLAANEISRRALIYFMRSWEADDNQAPFWFGNLGAGQTLISRGRGGAGPG